MADIAIRGSTISPPWGKRPRGFELPVGTGEAGIRAKGVTSGDGRHAFLQGSRSDGAAMGAMIDDPLERKVVVLVVEGIREVLEILAAAPSTAGAAGAAGTSASLGSR